MRSFGLLAIVAVTSLAREQIRRIDTPALRCSACIATADELMDRLDTGKNRQQDVELSARLNSKGERIGKVIPYQNSELRVIEVMEAVCPSMVQFVLVTDTQTGEQNFVDMNKHALRGTMDMNEDIRRDLQRKCEYMLEEYDEDLTKILMKGDDMRDARQRICLKMGPYCTADDIKKKDAYLSNLKQDSNSGPLPDSFDATKDPRFASHDL